MARFYLRPEQEDEFVESVIDAETQLEYQRSLVKFGKDHGRPATLSLDEGENWLRRRSMRRTDYVGAGTRIPRHGCPFSFTENLIFDWARDWKSEGVTEPDAEYLAHLMCRPIEEIETELDRRKNTRDGLGRLF